MAFYHVGGCDCPVGCCDCGETDKDRGERALRIEMYSFLKPLEFTAIYKGIVDKRRRDVDSVRYLSGYNTDYWKANFVRYENEPSLEKVIEAGHKVYDSFHEREYFTPKLMKDVMYAIINQSNFTGEEVEGLNQYFKDLFTYTKVEVVSEWE